MVGYPLIFACLSLLLARGLSLSCNASQMNFVSRYSLGKQDELNRTFAKIQEKLTTLNEISYHDPRGADYKISSIQPTFYYRDSKQKASFRGEDVIIIEGGILEVDLAFTWTKSLVIITNGTGTATGLSYELIFGKKLVVDGNTYSYELLDAMPFSMPWEDAFQITRLDPPELIETDKQALLKILNNLAPKDIVGELEEEVNKIYSYYLNASLHDKHFPIDTQFDYHWSAPGKQNQTISFQRRPNSVDVQNYGLISTFDVQIQNDTNWSCGTRKVIEMPLDPQIFGGIQEYVSFDFYQNVIRWAIEHQLLDTDLKQQAWGNRMFQFFAGDLYEVFSEVHNRFFASEVARGQCKGKTSGLKVYKNTNTTFNVTVNFDCSLQIRNDDICKFTVNLQITIAGKPKQDELDFLMISHQQRIDFTPLGQYQLINRPLAEAMIADSLNRLYQAKLFGSGWPQSPPRDYPHFRVEDNFTAILDSSHIPSLDQIQKNEQ